MLKWEDMVGTKDNIPITGTLRTATGHMAFIIFGQTHKWLQLAHSQPV